MRSLSEQTRSELGGSLSVLAMQKRDHEHLDRLLHQLELATEAERAPVLLRIHRLVFPHAFAEESVLWPMIRRHVGGGERMTLHVEQEHQEVNEIAVELQDPELSEPDRETRLRRLVAVLRDDVRDEEDVLLPRLQARMSTAALRRYGVAWWVVRRIAPTRPHPVVSRRPPGNAIAAVPLTVLDRARDRLDSWAVDRRPGATRAAAASRRLGAVAARVERGGPFRVGEHAATRRA
jgi:hypothetical protein